MINKKLGFYICDNIEYDSKIQACIHGSKNNKNVFWNFNKEFFNSYNWSKEPELTLDQLYDQRARALREKYDYIIISYSGGADSHNLLMSFIRQNLHVDEIIVNTMEKGDSNFKNINQQNFSARSAPANEHVFQTIPRLEEIQKLCPRTKINIFDLTDYLFKSFFLARDESWILDKKEKLHPANLTRFNYLYFSEVRKNFDKNKKITIILGIEKPRIFIHSKNKDIIIRFTDGAANTVGIMSDYTKEYSNVTIEYFYWSPDAVDIICKQAHVIKRWLNAFPENQHLWMGDILTNKLYRSIHEKVYRSLLYTTWNIDWFQGNKSTRDWYCEFDNWFVEDYKNSQQYQIWKLGLDYVEKNAFKFIKYSNNVAEGLVMFHQDHKIINLNHSQTI